MKAIGHKAYLLYIGTQAFRKEARNQVLLFIVVIFLGS
jgi:hypothetical protein